MVNNKNMILDGEKERFIPDVKVTMVNAKYAREDLLWKFVNSDKSHETNTVIDDDFNETEVLVPNPNYVEPSRLYIKWKSVFFKERMVKIEYHQMGSYMNDLDWVTQKFGSNQNILDYMGIIPFTPSVMINISPDWKGKKGMNNKKNLLKDALTRYLNACNRYDYWSAVIECGGDGDFVHAHVVAHVNPAIEKSVIGGKKSHIGKGNHKYELQKAIKSVGHDHNFEKGIEGVLKGNFAVQRIILRNQELVSDKHNYLKEELKPDGHKNAVVKGFPVCFTSKD